MLKRSFLPILIFGLLLILVAFIYSPCGQAVQQAYQQHQDGYFQGYSKSLESFYLTVRQTIGDWFAWAINKENSEIIVAISTFWIMVFTFILGVSTLLLWWSTSSAVEISKRALIDLERPYLFILDFNWLAVSKFARSEPGFRYFVTNGGKLPAVVTNVKLGIRINGPTPAEPADEPPIHQLLTAPFIGATQQREVTQKIIFEDDNETMEFKLRDGELARIPTGLILGQMFVKISIEYDGPITRGHETTSCWEWHPGKGAFTQFGGNQHNKRT